VLSFIHAARQRLLRGLVLLHDTRKLPPLAQLVQPGGVLDVSATHARALQSAADELFRANSELRLQRVPLFNIPDALEVLCTGAGVFVEGSHSKGAGVVPTHVARAQLRRRC
jgi:Mediator complex subunit MED14